MKLRAFSVMEMIVASAVFAGSILILLGVFPISARAIRQSQHRLIASHLAQNHLDRTRAQSYGYVQGQVARPETPTNTTAVVIHNSDTITLDYHVEQHVTEPQPGLLLVRVDVSWDSDGRPQTLNLETQIANTLP